MTQSKKTIQPVRSSPRREERVINFLTQDELRRLFKVIRSKRDKAIFLVAYRHGLRASEIGLLQRADVDVKQGRVSIHRLKGSISGVYPMQPDVLKAIRSYLRTREDESPYLDQRGHLNRKLRFCIFRQCNPPIQG